jgi:hypothetical protein
VRAYIIIHRESASEEEASSLAQVCSRGEPRKHPKREERSNSQLKRQWRDGHCMRWARSCAPRGRRQIGQSSSCSSPARPPTTTLLSDSVMCLSSGRWVGVGSLEVIFDVEGRRRRGRRRSPDVLRGGAGFRSPSPSSTTTSRSGARNDVVGGVGSGRSFPESARDMGFGDATGYDRGARCPPPAGGLGGGIDHRGGGGWRWAAAGEGNEGCGGVG